MTPSHDLPPTLTGPASSGRDALLADFEATARARPDAIALVVIADDDASDARAVGGGGSGGDREISYAALQARAEAIAAMLRARAIGPESIVGIAAEHDWTMIAALIGVLKCGAAFLPLDGTLPAPRLAGMMARCGVRVVLAPASHRAREAAGAEVIGLEVERPHPAARPATAASAEQRVSAPAAGAASIAIAGEADGASAAYVIYTSGSTGEPKGVLVPRSALANHARRFAETVALSPYDRVLQFANPGFDAAYEEILPALARGATLVLRSARMETDLGIFLRRCTERDVTLLDLPTAFWHVLTSTLRADGPVFPESVRCVVLGGEEPAAADVRFWDEHYGLTVRLLNTYGPTEATIIATAGDLLGRGEAAGDGVPLGAAIGGVRVRVREARGADGVEAMGEIEIAGAGVARGYVGAPALTAERFVPEAEGQGSRAYRTGDRALVTPAGEILFKGRQDRQVKVNGHRIQLEEVEQALLTHPAIASCAVLVRDNRLGGKHLVAYCVLARTEGPLPFEASPLGVTQLKAYLTERLPAFMIPGEFSFLEKFILNASGKIDRTKLPEVGYLDRKYRGLKPYAAPRPGLETALAEIWCGVLDLDLREISIDDPFEYLGGNSLYSIEVRYKAQEAGLLFHAGDLHLRQTVRGLAACCRQQGGLRDRAALAMVDYVNYARGVGRLVRRELSARVTRRSRSTAAAQRAFTKFYGALARRQNPFYLFFTKNLLHWLSATASFVPPSTNLVLIGSGLTNEEVTWVTRRMDRPFLHLPEEIDLPSMWDILFAVNDRNFGWLDVDTFIMNPALFEEMVRIAPDQAINCVWSHAACGPTKRPFSVLEAYFLFFNIEAIKALRADGVLARPYARYANARQVALLKRLIPGEPSRRAALTGTLRGHAFTHRLYDFQFGPLILHQLVANASGYKLNRVRFFTEIDSFNLYNYYSDEAIHVFPTIRKYDALPWSGIDQKRRLASDYLLMTAALDDLPSAYHERARMLERRIAEMEMEPARMAGEIREYLRVRGVSERTFARPEFVWLAEREWPRTAQAAPPPPMLLGPPAIAAASH